MNCEARTAQEDARGQELEHVITIDYTAGIALCILSGMTFAAAVSGWLFIFADLTDLRSRLDRMQAERTWQISDMGNALRGLEVRIEVVSGRLQQLQQATHRAGDGPGTPERKRRTQEKPPDAQSVPEEDAARSPVEEMR